MRSLMGLSASLLLSAVCAAQAETPAFPTYDIAQTCRTQADYAFAATLGQTDVARERAACAVRERDQMESAQALWPLASDRDKADCIGLAEARYGYLARCLDGSRSVRSAR